MVELGRVTMLSEAVIAVLTVEIFLYRIFNYPVDPFILSTQCFEIVENRNRSFLVRRLKTTTFGKSYHIILR